MRVRSLIEKLKNLDPEAKVFIAPPFDLYEYSADRIDVSKDEEGGKVYIGTDPLFLED